MTLAAKTVFVLLLGANHVCALWNNWINAMEIEALFFAF